MILSFLDVAPPVEFTATTAGIALAAVFFLVFSGIAVFAYKTLKRSVKMAFRMLIVAAILLIAVVGSLAFYFGIQSPKKTTPTPRPTPRSAR